MAYQLIYTSYASSLTHGRTGFSTVAKSEALPDTLVPEIERISQYDIPRGVVYAHRILPFGGQKYHVLTRTKDCGLDYTNRNNYIAHHLIFTEAEIDGISANPADIMAMFPQWADTFYGQPRFIREVAAASFDKYKVSTLPAEAWKARFGDCAYAASILRKSSALYAGVADAAAVLKLYGEALALLRFPRDAWNVSFTTQLLPSDKRFDFQWYASSGLSGADADVDVVSGKAKFLPTGRDAEYAREGQLTNAEKYNLKVANHIAEHRRFDIVHMETSFSPAIIGALVAAVVILAAAAYFAWAGFGERKSNSAPAGASPVAAAPAAAQAGGAKQELSAAQTLAAVREKIAEGDFSGAVALWQSGKYAGKSGYQAIIEGDISAKIDSMFAFAENVSLSPSASQSQKAQALKYMDILAKSGGFMTPAKKETITEKSAEILRKLQNK